MGERRRKLIQDYEDAKLALLLDEYAEAYGKVSTEQYEKDLADGKIRKISDKEADAQLNAILQRAEEEEAKGSRIATRFKGIARKVATVAVSFAIFFVLMVTVQAAGIDVFGTVGRWTDSLFHFESESGEKSGEKSEVKDQIPSSIMEIRKNIVLYGFPDDSAPSWIPDGFSLKNILFPENAESFLLENQNGQWLLFQIDLATSINSFGAEWIEKDENTVETIQVNGKQFYVFRNDTAWTGIFQNKTYRITIATNNNKSDLISIIQSIGGKINEKAYN